MLDILLSSLVAGLLFGSVLALVALGLTIIFGVMDIVNFAHGENGVRLVECISLGGEQDGAVCSWAERAIEAGEVWQRGPESVSCTTA